MYELVFRPAGVLACFLLTSVTGIWLTRTGRPYSSLIFNVHKLVALAAVVVTVVVVRNLLKQASPNTVVLLLAVLAAGATVCLFATGGLLGAGKTAALYLTVHRAAPVVAVASATALAYLLAARAMQ